MLSEYLFAEHQASAKPFMIKLVVSIRVKKRSFSYLKSLHLPRVERKKNRLRVVPHFSSGIVERAKRERA